MIILSYYPSYKLSNHDSSVSIAILKIQTIAKEASK